MATQGFWYVLLLRQAFPLSHEYLWPRWRCLVAGPEALSCTVVISFFVFIKVLSEDMEGISEKFPSDGS